MWVYSMHLFGGCAAICVCVYIYTLNSAVWADPSARLPVSSPPGPQCNSVTDWKPEEESKHLVKH